MSDNNLLSYAYRNVRSAAILTNSYVAGTVVGAEDAGGDYPHNGNQLIIYVDNTKGSADSAQVKVEFSHDGVTYYQESFSALSGTTDTVSLGEHSLGATGKYRLAIPIKDKYIKISAKATGTVTGSSMTINAAFGRA